MTTMRAMRDLQGYFCFVTPYDGLTVDGPSLLLEETDGAYESIHPFIHSLASSPVSPPMHRFRPARTQARTHARTHPHTRTYTRTRTRTHTRTHMHTRTVLFSLIIFVL
eukprot:GHVU01219094.1.p1 GENE.GHVU01219094.1~~GHVU01219094.1.p1  ORF type:complete len:109 (+),score=6.75 GHVU01219094.1:295-621(+)